MHYDSSFRHNVTRIDLTKISDDVPVTKLEELSQPAHDDVKPMDFSFGNEVGDENDPTNISTLDMLQDDTTSTNEDEEMMMIDDGVSSKLSLYKPFNEIKENIKIPKEYKRLHNYVYQELNDDEEPKLKKKRSLKLWCNNKTSNSLVSTKCISIGAFLNKSYLNKYFRDDIAEKFDNLYKSENYCNHNSNCKSKSLNSNNKSSSVLPSLKKTCINSSIIKISKQHCYEYMVALSYFKSIHNTNKIHGRQMSDGVSRLNLLHDFFQMKLPRSKEEITDSSKFYNDRKSRRKKAKLDNSKYGNDFLMYGESLHTRVSTVRCSFKQNYNKSKDFEFYKTHDNFYKKQWYKTLKLANDYLKSPDIQRQPVYKSKMFDFEEFKITLPDKNCDYNGEYSKCSFHKLKKLYLVDSFLTNIVKCAVFTCGIL